MIFPFLLISILCIKMSMTVPLVDPIQIEPKNPPIAVTPSPTQPTPKQKVSDRRKYKDCHTTSSLPYKSACDGLLVSIKYLLSDKNAPTPTGAPGEPYPVNAEDKKACEIFTAKAASIFSPPLDLSKVCCDTSCYCKEVDSPNSNTCGGLYSPK